MIALLLALSVAVPENRAQPGGRQIDLNVVVIPARGKKTLPPLYWCDGGPGIPGTPSAEFWETDGANHLRHRDMVLFDQRGTGKSSPLDCPEVRIGNPLQPTLDATAVQACRDRLSAKADLSRYSTADAVADLEAIRVALKHGKIDLIGLSYGTRLAMEYVRAHPDRVRAVVLLGALSPEAKLPLPFARGGQTVLDALVGQCAADAACHAAIPDLAADIASVKQPGQFWEGVRALLANTPTQRRLPWLLHEAAQGRTEPIFAAMKRPNFGSDGLLLSVSCPEDTLHIADKEIDSGTVFGDYRVRQQIAACKAWNVPPREVPRDFVKAKTPVLLMSGSMDGVTPPAWSSHIAAHLPNARVVTLPLLGHFPDGLTHMECYEAVIEQFFERGSAKDLDLRCIETMKPPPFALSNQP